MRVPAFALWPLALVVLLAVAACASLPSSAPVATSAVSTASGIGTVLVVRPIAHAAADTAGWRTALLGGATDGASPPPAGATLAEFIVREDTGATLSIVQPDAGGLHPGDRVTVVRPRATAGRASLGPLL